MTALELPRGEPIRIRDVSGTTYAMWRCAACGEMGRLQHSFPTGCLSCGASREELFYWPED
jgi:hypothetical protein